MHGGTRSGFISAASSAFVSEHYTEPWESEPFPACRKEEVKIIICLTLNI
jgi:hypothetical protein